jgi:hypothetical protein
VWPGSASGSAEAAVAIAPIRRDVMSKPEGQIRIVGSRGMACEYSLRP